MNAPANPGAPTLTVEQVREALQAAWNEFCDDAGAFPECFTVKRGPTLWADFQRSNFALGVMQELNAALAPTPQPADDPEAPTIADYEEVLADKRRLTRDLDVLLNGEGAAQQASLCDIVGQVRMEGIRSSKFLPATLAQPEVKDAGK